MFQIYGFSPDDPNSIEELTEPVRNSKDIHYAVVDYFLDCYEHSFTESAEFQSRLMNVSDQIMRVRNSFINSPAMQIYYIDAAAEFDLIIKVVKN